MSQPRVGPRCEDPAERRKCAHRQRVTLGQVTTHEKVDALLDRLSEAELDSECARLLREREIAVSEAGYRAHTEEDRPQAPIEDPATLKRLFGT